MCNIIFTTEAEYVAMRNCVKEARFVRNTFYFLTPGEEILGITGMEENQGAIALAENPLRIVNTLTFDITSSERKLM